MRQEYQSGNIENEKRKRRLPNENSKCKLSDSAIDPALDFNKQGQNVSLFILRLFRRLYFA